MSTVKVRTNDEWLRDLRTGGDGQASALEDLRAHLLRAARYALVRQGRLAQLSAATIDQMAEDCAQEALIAILARLDDFRGDSRFTTWTYKFAINTALVAGRREGWKHVSLDALVERSGASAWPASAESPLADPEQAARRAEAWRIVRDVIDDELTERQRQALKAVIVDEVPLDELVRHWGSSRNALYKLLHDARQRLRSRLEARGFQPSDVLAPFSGSG
jgi:RNA polymerase sigma-70 factor, ECF subfamily